VSKQRNGPIGDVKLSWLQDYTRFVPLDQSHDEGEQFRPY